MKPTFAIWGVGRFSLNQKSPTWNGKGIFNLKMNAFTGY
jgi:hypothetical protein